MAVPKFEIETPLEKLFLWTARADQLASALFEGGTKYTWDDNVKVENKLLPREGEWLGRNPSSGVWRKAVKTVPSAFPVFLDPGAGRTDHEGGLALVRGAGIQPITARTNMIGYVDDPLNLRAGSELIVGALPVGHDFAGAIGLIPLNEQVGATEYYVVAVVEEVLGAGMYRVTTVSYWSGTETATSVPPTTTP